MAASREQFVALKQAATGGFLDEAQRHALIDLAVRLAPDVEMVVLGTPVPQSLIGGILEADSYVAALKLVRGELGLGLEEVQDIVKHFRRAGS